VTGVPRVFVTPTPSLMVVVQKNMGGSGFWETFCVWSLQGRIQRSFLFESKEIEPVSLYVLYTVRIGFEEEGS